MINIIKKTGLKSVLFTSLVILSVASKASTATKEAFSIDGNSLRQIATGQVAGEPVIFTAELQGGVGSYTLEGKKRWSGATNNKAVLFEINSADLNNDNADDLIAASADGSIYAWSGNSTTTAKAKPLWTFTPDVKVRFSEVAITKVKGEVRIYAGGNNYILYELDNQGKLLSETKLDGTVRKIEAGNFLSKEKTSLFIFTYVNDKFRWQFMGIIDPETKKVLKTIKPNNKNLGKNVMVTDIDIADLDQDGLDDILFFGGGKAAQKSVGTFTAFNGQFEPIANYMISGKDKQRYAHVYGSSLLPVRNEVMFQFGGITYLVDAKGKLINKVGTKNKGLIFNDFQLEPLSKKLLAAGQVGGGNTVYSFDLTDKQWFNTKHQLTGRLAQVEQNINNLYQQTLDFTMPTYQQKSDKPWVMITKAKVNKEVETLDGAEFIQVKQERWTEAWDRSSLAAKLGKIALKKDKRGKYKESQQQLVKKAKAFERKGEHFVIWAGHGNDPFGVSIDTMEAILAAAPNTAMGFIYAEMHNIDDPRVQYFVSDYMPRLAKALRKNGKAKLYFRYKNVFWGATSHQKLWKDMFFSGQYSDILVPSAEDTTSRTQDINFTGRVGMFLGGYVDDFAIRLVDDNPTSWRPLSPGGQRSVSPYLRAAALTAAYGARIGIIFDSAYTQDPGLNILFALMKSGVLPIVEPEAMESVSSWMLIDKVDEKLVHSIEDHHSINQYNKSDTNAVMSVAQIQWAGTNLPEHDYSKAALGVDYRWLNYIPELPNGMVPIAPIELATKLSQKNTPYFVSDGRLGYQDNKPLSAEDFLPVMADVIAQGKKQLPIIVEGASWSVIRLDANHVRIILIDQGYIDPQDRKVTIKFQGRKTKWLKDVLSNENLSVIKGSTELTVPAGSMRFIDVGY